MNIFKQGNLWVSSKTNKYTGSIINLCKIVCLAASLFVLTPVGVVETYTDFTNSATTPWGQTVQTSLSIDTLDDKKLLLEKVELLASQSVILASNYDYFKSFSPEHILGLARRIDVLDPSSRPLVQEETITILENDVSRVQANESPRVEASLTELQSVLQYAHQQYAIENNYSSDSQLQEFDSNDELTFYEASQLIEKRGIDPYSREARPYYCELGFQGLDTMGVYYVSFCSKLTPLIADAN